MRFVVLLILCVVGAAAAEELAPFGTDLALAKRQLVRGTSDFTAEIACAAGDAAGAWTTGSTQARDGQALATVADGTLALRLDGFDPQLTVLSYPLPAGGDGDAWDAGRADWIALECRSRGAEAMLALVLTAARKDAAWGNPRATFTARPGEWRRVVLPVGRFGAKNFRRIVQIGIAVSEAAAPGTVVEVRNVRVGALPWSDASWKSHRTRIGIDGTWRFSPDPADAGIAAGWHTPDFADDGWRTISSGKSWHEQGVRHGGWAWYRQGIAIPAACAGASLRLSLAAIPYDDDVWFNGERVGGIHGIYRYNETNERVYAIPSRLVRAGAVNSIAIRTWGIDGMRWSKADNGLVKGVYAVESDPYAPMLRRAGQGVADELPPEAFDLSEAQRSLPVELVVRLPAEAAPSGARAACVLVDAVGEIIAEAEAQLRQDAGVASAVLPFSADAVRELYLRHRFRIWTTVLAADGAPLYAGVQAVDRPNRDARDRTGLPELPATEHDTPYGRLRLVDEIDAATPTVDEPHPYMHSAAISGIAAGAMPGYRLQPVVGEILGRRARTCGDASGWFAYRIGRGRLPSGRSYLLRIEYPEDVPRYCPIEIETGQNYQGIGWKNGVGPGDPYDDYPLSGRWEWYDAIVASGDHTLGAAGAESAPGEHGFWIYFNNKRKPDTYFAMYRGGPAIGRIRLYEIDPVRHAPVIRAPAGQPQRTLLVDWERQAEQDPDAVVGFCRLMGFNAVAPIMLKWCTANWGEPVVGYASYNLDARGYWIHQAVTKPEAAVPAVPGRPTMHARWLAATRGSGVRYMPRVEYGGSEALPHEARAIGGDGKPAKPNRFGNWSANLLHPATWEDMARIVDALVQPYAASDPQLAGVLMRMRCDRMPISYGREDVALYCREAGIDLPPGDPRVLAAWAASGAGAEGYRRWWEKKRAAFHLRLRDRLLAIRPDLVTLYHNWDSDKWNLGIYDQTASAYFRDIAAAGTGRAMQVYERNLSLLRSLSGDDLVRMIRSGRLSVLDAGSRADHGIDMDLYRDAGAFQPLAPVNYRYLADSSAYIGFFATGGMAAVCHMPSYDEGGYKRVNPKYECNELTAAGPAFSMALEVMAWFHGDARTLTWTSYTYGRGFAEAHRRFAQAFLALPAIPGTIVEQPDAALRIRRYDTPQGVYVGIANRGFTDAEVQVPLSGSWKGSTVTDLVSGATVPARVADGVLRFAAPVGAMRLNAYLVR